MPDPTTMTSAVVVQPGSARRGSGDAEREQTAYGPSVVVATVRDGRRLQAVPIRDITGIVPDLDDLVGAVDEDHLRLELVGPPRVSSAHRR